MDETLRFAAIDVETPNYRNDRMSAIGVVLMDGASITDTFYTLVNPEAPFDAFNIRLTGITPRMVLRSPTFAQLWPRLQPLLEGRILAAHNAPFDLSVLSGCIRRYDVSWQQTVDYVCTCQMGRRLVPELPDHRLNTMADHFGLPLDHHNAASDTMVCAQLLQRYLTAGADPSRFMRRYDLNRTCTVRERTDLQKSNQ